VKAEAMSKPLGTARSFCPIGDGLLADAGFLTFVKRFDLCQVRLLYRFIREGHFTRWTPLQMVCVMTLFVPEFVSVKEQVELDQGINDLWADLKSLNLDASSVTVMQTVQFWLTEKIVPVVLGWRIGGFMHRIWRTLKHLPQKDWNGRVEGIGQLIRNSPNQYLFS
jgi:hypothetical protein